MIDTIEAPEVVPVQRAGRGRRLLAYIIDAVLVSIGALSGRALTMIGMATGGRIVSLVWLIAIVIVQIRYLAIRGQTLGKIPTRIAIVDPETKLPPGYLRAAVIRQMPVVLLQYLYPVLLLPYVIVDALLIFAPNRRCLHDYIARTEVIAVGSDWQ